MNRITIIINRDKSLVGEDLVKFIKFFNEIKDFTLKNKDGEVLDNNTIILGDNSNENIKNLLLGNPYGAGLDNTKDKSSSRIAFNENDIYDIFKEYNIIRDVKFTSNSISNYTEFA